MTFVDTPGLVDGGMNYPFDVNEGILWLGDLVDMIFVFFDPIGQVHETLIYESQNIYKIKIVFEIDANIDLLLNLLCYADFLFFFCTKRLYVREH